MIVFQFIWGVWGVLMAILSVIIVTPIYAVIFLVGGKQAPFIAHGLSQIWARFLAITMIFWVKVHGKKKLNKEQAYIFVSNHNSQIDIPVSAICTNHTFRFLSKAELAKIPLLGFIIKNLYILVNRSNKKDRSKSLEAMKNSLNDGISVFIYPEGTRNRTDKPLKNFFDGAFRLAVETGVPLAVVTIIGTKKISAAGTFQLQPGRVDCYWEDPIDTTDMTSKDVEELREQVKEMMIKRLIQA